MNRIYLACGLCAVLSACGGSKKPEVDPAVQVTPEAAPSTTAVQPVSMEDPTNSYSYALGLDLGKAIGNVSVPLNMSVLFEAIKDQLDSSRKPMLSDSAAELALQDMLLKMQQKKEQDNKANAKKMLDEQVAFLAKNINEPGVKVTTKGVQYKVIKEGAGITPKVSDKVQVHYVGTLMDGTEFDNSVKRGEPLEFPLNAVIEGWQDLLLVMKEGMKVKAWIPSALGYGEAGVEPMIPGNALLVFEVELLKVFADIPAAEAGSVSPAAAPESTTPAETQAPSEAAPK
ncbi:MAG: FKBP-type peptidyl-prolyl cis-trans isomerase [Fibrobacter sp.]|nr:FKBP-type peptidyl-prolyl cis-trans isomerase [Fibrobacter sp.]